MHQLLDFLRTLRFTLGVVAKMEDVAMEKKQERKPLHLLVLNTNSPSYLADTTIQQLLVSMVWC